MRIRNAKEIGALVRENRLKLRLSQAQLAERVDVSRLWIVNLEKGKSTAQLDLVLRTLDILGLALDMSATTTAPHSDSIDLDKLLRTRTGKGIK
jgi:HTH-type transcriptional regulator / antitoxin HipB